MRAPVDVYGPDKDLIGRLQGIDIDSPGREVVLALDVGLRIALDKSWRNRKISRMDLTRTGRNLRGLMEIYEIPPHADVVEEPLGDGYHLRWLVLVASNLEVYEILFDDPRFEPVGKRCSAAAAEERWWIRRRHGSSQLAR